MRRVKPLQIYGPRGLHRMNDLMFDSFSEDIKVRIEGLEKERPEAYKVNVHEIEPGIVYDSAGIKITAFPVLHGNWKEAYGFRINTPDRSIVISGDTRPCKSFIAASKNIDIICFLDDDIILSKNYFKNLIKTYSLFPKAIRVGGYINNEVNGQEVNSGVKISNDSFLKDGFVRKMGKRFLFLKYFVF